MNPCTLRTFFCVLSLAKVKEVTLERGCTGFHNAALGLCSSAVSFNGCALELLTILLVQFLAA